MDETLEIVWSYTPEDYFEEPYEEDFGTYQLIIDDGRATVTMSARKYDDNPNILEEIFEEIEGLFAGAQLINHRPFELRRAGRKMFRERSDGGNDISILMGTAKISLTAGSVDVKVTDADGNVVSDTKAERIRERKKFAQLAAQHRRKDDLAQAILDSYGAAVRHPDNELVHLYDVFEALRKHFGGQKQIRSALKITRGKQDRLGKLANGEPLRQGRHRGNHAGQLRDATNEELNEARAIAKSMIRAYLEYLDQQGTGP